MELTTEYSPWWILGCLVLGAVFAFVLYRRERRLSEMATWLKGLLAVLRALAVAAMAFLLIGPFLSSIDKRTEKPVILFAIDNSGSILLDADSAFYKGDFTQNIDAMLAPLEEKYEVERYTFDKELQPKGTLDHSGRQTDIGKAMEQLYDRNSNRNIGAVILATDGISTIGSNPSYAAQRMQAPVYTIALGDTTVKQDVILDNVAHNRLAYLGNDFPMEVLVRADRLKGSQTMLSIKSKGETLVSRTVDIDREGFLKSIPVQLSAKSIGRQRYDISLRPIDGETTTKNNYRSIYVDVIDSRQKILLLAHAPHPDIAAIRSSIESNLNYEVTVSLAKRFSGDISEYDLVILHQLPSRANPMTTLLSEAGRKSKPLFFVQAFQSDREALTAAGAPVSTSVRQGSNTTDASPAINKNFSLFTINDALLADLPKWPPLTSTFGDYAASNSSEVLFRQRIGTVETEQPLLAFNEVNGQKMGVLIGEGIWRWRLIDHAEHGDNSRFDGLMGKVIQYMATREDKRLFRVYSKSRYTEDQNVMIEAEFYNKSLEAITEPEVTIILKNKEGAEFPFTFSKGRNNYMLDAGRLPVGEYSYVAATSLGGEGYSATGEFVVTALLMEAINTTADHQLLYSMSQNSGGEMVYPKDLTNLTNLILEKKDIVPIIYSTRRLSEIIELKWIFFLLLGLLSIEWFVRKYNGAY